MQEQQEGVFEGEIAFYIADPLELDTLLERVEAIEADVTGEGYIYQMFAHELANHEYGYTYDLEETLDAVGLTAEQIKGNKALHHGLQKALKRYGVKI